MDERFGDYLLLEELGRGGMGAVYLARHVALDRTVALKLLSPGTELDAGSLKRFKREAEAGSALAHPGLARVYDFGTVDDVAFIAMERVEGRTLSRLLTAAGPLAPVEALRLARAVLEALAVCHQAGLIHRDIKPANVMVDPEGRPRLLDLGLAKLAGRTVITRTGQSMGTPQYMAPEMLSGGEHDAPGDVYQVGLLLYECVAGRPAFASTSFEELVRTILNDPVPPLELPQGPGAQKIRGFLERALEKDPRRRFRNAGEAVEFLSSPTRPLRTARVSGPPATPPASTQPPARRGALALTLAVAAALGVAGYAALAALSGAGSEPAVRRTAQGWEVSWRTWRPGTGVVEVRTSDSPIWSGSFHEESNGFQHRVAFRQWCAPGESLAFRTRLYGAEAGRDRPLEVAGDEAPQELEIAGGAASAEARWFTAARVRGRLAVAGSAVSISEAVPCQAHRLRVTGLEPGRTHTVQVLSSAGVPLAARPLALPALRDVIEAAIGALHWTRADGRWDIRADALHAGDPAAIANMNHRWARRLDDELSVPRYQQPIARYLELQDRVADPSQLTTEPRLRLIHALEAHRELYFIAHEAFGVEPPTHTPEMHASGTWPEPALPPGFAPLFALQFGDGGKAAGRTPPPAAWRAIQVPGPVRWNEIEHEMGFGGSIDEETRSSYHAPPPLFAGPVPRRVYLGFRMVAATSCENLWVSLTRQGGDGLGEEIAALRSDRPGRVFEGYVRLDERRLTDRQASLAIRFDAADIKYVSRGLVLDWLALFGERPDGPGR